MSDIKEDIQFNLSPPWVSFAREVNALFEEDPEVEVKYFEDENVLRLFVQNAMKADALAQLLPLERHFGNVTLKIQVIPANEFDSPISLFQKAFADNPAVNSIEVVENLFDKPMAYVMFQPKVVQYFNDDLGDFNAVHSTLFEDLARDVFEDNTAGCVFFCTSLALGTPLGEWP